MRALDGERGVVLLPSFEPTAIKKIVDHRTSSAALGVQYTMFTVLPGSNRYMSFIARPCRGEQAGLRPAGLAA